MRREDKVLESNSFVTTDVTEPVRIRMEGSLEDVKPMSLVTLLENAASRGPDRPALKVKRDGSWRTWTYGDYLSEVRTVAKAFISLGLEPGRSVAISGFNSPEWFMADLAAVFCGSVAAGIYATNSAETCRFILADCGAQIAVVEDEAQLKKFLEVRSELPELKAIVQYLGEPKPEHKGVISWKQLLDLGRPLPDSALDSRLSDHVAVNRCCHLCYTSGTTGPPKGVMLNHDNLAYTAAVLCRTFSMADFRERIVSYLPLSHVAANTTDIFVMMRCVGCVYFADRDALKGTLTATLREAQPTLFLAVPRVWEKIHEKMMEVGRGTKGLKRAIADWAKGEGLKRNREILSSMSSSNSPHQQPQPSIAFRLADRIVFQKVKSTLGLSKCVRFFSAAAPMPRSVLDYFMSLDIRILEIYGMSECSGPQLSNSNQCQRAGSIGKTLEGFQTKISKDKAVDSDGGGEIRMKGRNVMMGYLGNESKTADAFDSDGWLRSGDIGREDSDGFVSISGRIKELLVTAGGENVAPVPIEDAVKARLPCASQVVVVGDRKKFLSCLITMQLEVDPKTLMPTNALAANSLAWLRQVQQDDGKKPAIDSTTKVSVTEAMLDDSALRAVQKAVDGANSVAVSNPQQIRKWRVLETDLSVPGGELGPTMKVKRHVVAEKYADVIEAMYS